MDGILSGMAVAFDLPKGLEDRLREQVGDLGMAAKRATLIDLFGQGKLSLVELGEALGASRSEVKAMLARAGVFEGAPGHGDIDQDAAVLGSLFKAGGSKQGGDKR